MGERIETIMRCYEALEYEINRQEALKKISTLHCELKFKDTNNFVDRFLQAASIVEKNSSVFKSACGHVDIVTTILEYLHTIGVKLTLNECTDNEVVIIYIMYIVCEDEIPSFLKAALMNNSRLEYADGCYTSLISSYIYGMIVLEDSDLYAVISYFRATSFFLFKIHYIYVQESIKQKFLWILEKYFQDLYTSWNLPIFTFHRKQELLYIRTLILNLESVNMVSIWSEDITAAKELATLLRRDITFINTHFEFCSDITFSWKKIVSPFNWFRELLQADLKDGDINPKKYVGSVNDLFYNGRWQKPVKNGYWIHDRNTYAHATREDVILCIKSSVEASIDWSLLPIVSRKEILKNLASTLECNGKFDLAETVLNTIKLGNLIRSKLKWQDERLELIKFHGSKNVVSIYHANEETLFLYLALSFMIGNCVIVLHNENSCTLAPYFNMFSTAGVPVGVVNLLSSRDMCQYFSSRNDELDEALNDCTSINHIILPLK
ncbi:uncharacterized protein LOC112457946 [Temnothorax curvispinosus]|uniref:Uncharacterized protein LOC112457946 n=1 Tax=Temnothorax curvispinosus TaxID=300111 RepID=A0A6J1Q4D9_9HYME|nr:uncharacterized protein LOC112457946 [Temnothorax curvispinosus]